MTRLGYVTPLGQMYYISRVVNSNLMTGAWPASSAEKWPSGKIKRPVLVLVGTKDGSDAGERWRTLLPDCHFMFVFWDV
jgi:hypothetical protein